MLYPTTCVRLRYGCLHDMLSGFSWEHDYTHYPIAARALGTIRFDSRGGFAYHDQHLHPSTNYSVSPRRFHFSVSTSLMQPVREY
jgi:hypothetical protein